jgi:hypothetical protein
MIRDKKPSAYAAMKDGTTVSHVYSEEIGAEPEEKRGKGRPSKEESRKKKMALASAMIGILVNSKPTKAKMEEYFLKRITELDAEKR